MQFLSTRGGAAVSAAQAIVQGMCPSGGLYVPADFPQLDAESLLDGGYASAARAVMEPYLAHVSQAALMDMIAAAYHSFDDPAVTPVRALTQQQSVLELWHGPTMAFKDVALQMLPHLMRSALDATGERRQLYILVATSGDTGKAALAGFADAPGCGITVFYPEGKVSRVQELQMSTQEGGNVAVCGVRGNFDDAQSAVKRIFADRELATRLADAGVVLSSANSINVGRLVPQVVYYFAAYAQLLRAGAIQAGDAVEFCVPTGNFGDILAGYYAKRMGLPVSRLVVASDKNNVLFDFLTTGTYDRDRPFFTTTSPSPSRE